MIPDSSVWVSVIDPITDCITYTVETVLAVEDYITLRKTLMTAQLDLPAFHP